DELSDKELKQIKADDQVIQTILLGFDIGIQEKKAKLFNEWEMFTSNEGESIESYYHRFLKLMNDLKRNKHFPEKIASNLKFLNNLQPECSRHVTVVHQTKDLHTTDYTQLYDFQKYNQKETILLDLPEDIYAAVDSCETTQEIWLRVQQMMKGFDIGIQEKKAKLFNEWESRHVTIVHQSKDLHTADYTQLYDFLKYNQKEVYELKAERLAKIQDPLALMANSNNPYASPAPHQDLSPFNQNYMQQPMPNPEDITDPTIAMNMALVLMAKAFKLNYSTPTNNNQRISSNPRNRQIAQPAADLDEIEEVNANCILMANLQQASSSSTQTDSTPVYDTDGSAE
nr:hypothetical protein [Tanacetum cinerariifolium]